jgi:hypothetical protein
MVVDMDGPGVPVTMRSAASLYRTDPKCAKVWQTQRSPWLDLCNPHVHMQGPPSATVLSTAHRSATQENARGSGGREGHACHVLEMVSLYTPH